MKEVVVPGEMVAETTARMENTYVENGKTYSKVLGLFDDEKKTLVALEGGWSPRIGDVVVGIVKAARNSVYEVNLDFFGRCLLIGSKFDRQTYKPGDVIEAEVKNIEDRTTLILWRPRNLYGGTMLEIKPTKVPRVIGKNNTMIEQIAQITKSSIVVGTNGLVWIKGGNVELATTVIRKIESEAHTSGLTERVKQMLESSSRA